MNSDTQAMQAHLAEISAMVEPGAHAAVRRGDDPPDHRLIHLTLDQAGWHMSPKLAVPDNITLLPLPPRSPELNPVENPGSKPAPDAIGGPGQAIWQFMRDNWLSNRVFQTYDDILAHCCEAWNRLTDQPWSIRSIGMRDWAQGC